MSRRDFYYDTSAPKPTKVLVGVSAFVLRGPDELLLIRRTDNGLFTLPGGLHEVGETMTQTLVREVQEETGLTVAVTGLVGIYSDPQHIIAFTGDDPRQDCTICFRARPVRGDMKTSEESSEVRWVRRAQLSSLPFHPAGRIRIDHGLANREPFYT